LSFEIDVLLDPGACANAGGIACVAARHAMTITLTATFNAGLRFI
jgi:hypothetical protein